MNAKELTLKNIQDNSFVAGKSVKGKGLEVFEANRRIMYIYKDFSDKVISNFKELITKYDASRLFVSSYYRNGIWSGNKTFENQDMTFQEFYDLVLSCKEEVNQFSIELRGEFLGYVSVSKYNSSKDSQAELLMDLLKLEGTEVYGDFHYDYWDHEGDSSVLEFESDSEGSYYNGDYYLVHGNKVCEDTDECIYIDGRMDNYNESEMDFFEIDESGWLKEIDPNESISVYHRKSKDWYIGYSLDSREMVCNYKDEDYTYEKDKCEEESIYFYEYKENKELLEKVTDALKSIKEDLENRCFIANELDEDYDYRESDIYLKTVEFIYDNTDTLKEDIMNKISWDANSIKIELNSVYTDIINSKYKVLDDFKVEVEHTRDCDDSIFTTYNHLCLIKRLSTKLNYELVYSLIPGTNTSSWAIKRDEEEYHFNLINLIASVELDEQTIRDFLETAITAIEKRKLMKIEEAELLAKASKVFVGISDSLSSGNCEMGTNQFVNKHLIDTKTIGGIRGDVLLEMEKSNFTLRAVHYALTHHNVA